MDKSTNQELNRMTVRHRLFGVVISTLLGFSAYALTAQEGDEADDSASIDKTTAPSETDREQNAEPVEDQLTKEILQEQTKDEFKEYMLNLDQYSANDQKLIRMEYQRRCSDESKKSVSDLCPDVYFTWGDTERDETEIDSVEEESDDEQSMPELEETPVETLVAHPNENTENVTDPRRNNKPSGNKNADDAAWRSK